MDALTSSIFSIGEAILGPDNIIILYGRKGLTCLQNSDIDILFNVEKDIVSCFADDIVQKIINITQHFLVDLGKLTELTVAIINGIKGMFFKSMLFYYDNAM